MDGIYLERRIFDSNYAMIFLLFCSLHVFLSDLSIFVSSLPLNLIDFHLTPISHLKISPFIETFQAVYFNETELKNAILSQQNPVRIKFEKIDDRSYQFDLWLDTSFYDSNSLVLEIVGNRSTASSVVDNNFNYFYTGHEVDNEQVTIIGSVSTDSWLFEGEISKFNGHQKIILEPLNNYDVTVTHNIPIDFKLIFYFETDIRRNWFKRNQSTRYRRWMLPPISYDEDESWLPPNVLHQPVDTTIVFNDENRSSKNSIKNYLTYKHRNRLDVNKKKTTCFLYLQADHLLFEKFGSKKAVVETLMRHVQRLNYIYNDIDFDGDGNPDKINFIVKRIKVYTSDALKDPAYRFAQDSFTVEKYLEAFSEENYDSFCLVYMFTYRDFEMGTLGLAWTGDIRNAGGVCERYGHYRGSMKSLNTGIVTLLNYGKFVPSIISHITFAHEIGHNFGSPHDPPHCVPGGKNGNFIMYSRATPGNKKNNYQFSQCSIASINSVLNLKARSHWFGCFQESPKSLCGNGIVEDDEECDCGWEDDCKESCCFPQRVSAVLNEQPCKLKPNKLCSPSQGACCDSECRFKYADKCRDENNCRSASYCDGWSAKCPTAMHKPNHTKCSSNSVCFMGECTSSICFAYGLESCQCNKTEQLCHLCCKMPGPNATCQSTFEWSSIDSQISLPKTKAKRGAICNNYRGYCDNYGHCRDIDPTGPLLAIKNLLFSNDLFLKILLLTTVFTIAIFVIVAFMCSNNNRKIDRKRTQKSSSNVHKSHTKRQKKQSVSKISAKIKSKVLNVSTQQPSVSVPNPQNLKNSRSQKDKSNPSTKKISSRIKTHKTDQPLALTTTDHQVTVAAKTTAKQSKSKRKNKKSSKSIATKKQQSFEIDTEISKKVGNWLSESQKELNSSKIQRTTTGCDLSVAKVNTSEIVPQTSDDINSNLDTVQSDLDVLISKC